MEQTTLFERKVPQPLAAGDTLALGKASLRFVPFCGEFRW